MNLTDSIKPAINSLRSESKIKLTKLDLIKCLN